MKLKQTAKKTAKRPVPKNRKSRSVPPFIIMGLGNPGPRYELSRHNIGYHVTDLIMQKPPMRLRRRLFASYFYLRLFNFTDRKSIVLIRSSGYMNNSGEILPSVMRRYRFTPEDFIVIVDNIDLPPGVCRLKKGGGDAGHNGLKSLISRMGSRDFYRLYIGVGRPAAGVSVVDHVLGNPEADDSRKILQACVRAADAIKSLADKPVSRVMEELNRREYS